MFRMQDLPLLRTFSHTLLRRRRQPELMDSPDLVQSLHDQALAGLRRINRWSRTGAALWSGLSNLTVQLSAQQELTILDIACGSGDQAIWLARRLQQHGVRHRIHGVDISGTAVATAGQQAAEAGTATVTFHQCDVLHDPFPLPQYDVVMNSLFLHHLDEPQVVRVLQRMAAAARQRIIIDDLRRTRLGYFLAWTGCRLLSRSPIVHFDGPVSVEGAFTDAEILQLAAQAGLQSARLQRHWPQRFLLTWQPNRTVNHA
jgi:2-polyprenyl-3-methyl-5-hydroxy-6-metoxy-1,4-benzoquinol methylase